MKDYGEFIFRLYDSYCKAYGIQVVSVMQVSVDWDVTFKFKFLVWMLIEYDKSSKYVCILQNFMSFFICLIQILKKKRLNGNFT